ncbi:mobile element transfer protein [Streptomyces malaysiensis]|uniref:mobile element transfer protein n=1 Tax=Streptomyces malaysiensis TaxID=92644 RepID=UPI0009A1CCD0|nr:mobile element transfer protein [Streptomyces autolyticus]
MLRRFRNVARIGPVRVGIANDQRGGVRHTAVCTTPRCDFSAGEEVAAGIDARVAADRQAAKDAAEKRDDQASGTDLARDA